VAADKEAHRPRHANEGVVCWTKAPGKLRCASNSAYQACELHLIRIGLLKLHNRFLGCFRDGLVSILAFANLLQSSDQFFSMLDDRLDVGLSVVTSLNSTDVDLK
jgi:hypothetical protein